MKMIAISLLYFRMDYNCWMHLTDDDIVIATTSSDPWETETFKVTAVNGTTITLNDTAKYEHLGEFWC